MLTNEETKEWLRARSFSEATQTLVLQIQSSPPSRRVQGGRGNWRGFYASAKMGHTNPFESGNELAHIKDKLESDKDVLEYYAQPPKIGLTYPTKNGRSYSCQHTPDFFVIREDKAGWEECKTEEELLNLAKKSPNRYVQNEDGSWHCPPGEAYAEERGLYYRLCSSAEIDPIRLRNLDWLADYYTEKLPSVDKKISEEIFALVKSELGITYAEILKSVEGIEPEHLNILIVTEKIYVDLSESQLGRSDKVHVFPDQEMAFAYRQIHKTKPISFPEGFQLTQVDVGASLSWDGEYWEISNLGNERISLSRSDGKTIDLLNKEFDKYLENGKIIGVETQTDLHAPTIARELILKASHKDHSIAQERLKVIEPYLRDNPPLYPGTSIRRWRKAYRDAEKSFSNGYVGLLPKQAGKNSQPRIDPDLIKFTDEFLTQQHENPKLRRSTALYRQFKEACKNHEPRFNPPSEKWFRKRIQQRSGYQQTLAREGSRAAKQKKHFRMDTIVPRHGDLPWQDVQIDHTQIDVETIASILSLETCSLSSAIQSTNINLGRPWATFAIETHTRRILAVYLSYEEPSVRSCLMIIRTIVKRYKRLPRRFTVDNGPEFDSIDFNTLLAYYGCDKRHRPPGEPRYGAPVERIIGTTNTQFLHELQGQTRLMRNPRQLTKTVNPKGQAVWTLGELCGGLEKWAYQIYDNRPHITLGVKPSQAYEIGIASGGRRDFRRIDPNDETFQILTMPSPPGKTTRIVQPNGRGVKIDHFYYWCEAFNNSEIERASVQVKREPFDISIALAFVKGRWHKCISQYNYHLKGLTEKEIRIISEELRKRKSNHSKKTELSDKELVEFLTSAEAMEGELLKHRLRALENKTVVKQVEKNQIVSCDAALHNSDMHSINQGDSDKNEEMIIQALQEIEDSSDELEYFGGFCL